MNNPFEAIDERLRNIENLLLDTKVTSDIKTECSIWLDLDQLCDYMPQKPSKATLYIKLANGEIPGYKDGKKWYFKRTEIDDYLSQGKIKSNSEIKSETEDYLSNKRKLPNGK
ncbi:helix-turn-helix domain-containing protein [Algibacter sp. PT7-4]|uniref:helix-turn-helix domain-containing protein n=1 Tax=Algibacter ulvanivorans TaxID=3400999 RepID=UPI003AAC91A3